MHQPVDGCRRGHRVLEDPLPLGEGQIAGQQHAAAFVSLRQQSEQYLHLLAALLDIAHLVDDQAVMACQLLDLFAQPQVALGHQQILHQHCATGVFHPASLRDQFMGQGAEQVALARAA